MAETTTNGRPPTDEAKRLVSRHYDDLATASGGATRLISEQLIRATIGSFDPNNVTLADLDRMRWDPMIRLALSVQKALIIRADWAIECEDPAIKAGMTEIVDRVYTPWMRTGLNSLDYGFQPAVKSYELGKIDAMYTDGDGNNRPVWEDDNFSPVVLGSPIPLEQELVRVKLKKGRFDGITTTFPLGEDDDNTDPDRNTIPPEWCLWFVHEFEATKRNWYGKARIASAYWAWYSFWFNWLNRDRHAEMDADPALQVWFPPGDFKDADGAKKSNREAALMIGDQLRGGATIAWPSDVHISDDGKPTTTPLWKAEFLTGGENLPAFNDLLTDLRLEKLRASMVPEEVLTEALRGTGSRATSGNRITLFTETMEQIVRDLDRMWNERQLRAVVEANWGPDAPPCRKITTGFQEKDLALNAKLLESAFNADPNALPVDFEDIMRQLDVPSISKAEQQDREDQIAQAQADQQAAAAEAAAQAGGVDPNAPAGAPPGAPQLPPGADPASLVGQLPGELMAGQAQRRRRKYETERIYLHSKTVATTAPGWARREGQRRDRNVAALAERMDDVVRGRYEDAFNAAVEAIRDEDTLQLSAASTAKRLAKKVTDWVKRQTTSHTDAVTGELASIYHTAGLAELNRLGLSADSWDVGRDEVQEWARFRAGELIKTIDRTVVEQHLRPWLATELQKLGQQNRDGIATGTMELAQRMSDKFQGYPQWMSERVIRTESMIGYNLSAADMWERIGVQEVEMYDGLGGVTGQTDEECLARNGERCTIDEFREHVKNEHPNGTLGAIPVVVGVELRPLEPGLVQEGALMSGSIHGVTDDGLILSMAEVGRAMAGA